MPDPLIDRVRYLPPVTEMNEGDEMEHKEKEFRNILRQWHETILAPWHEELNQRLGETKLSSLYASIPDCFESFYEIYYELLPALLQTSPNDYENLHDHINDVGGLAGALQHIKSHIIDAEEGFGVLIKLLAEKAERKEKGYTA